MALAGAVSQPRVQDAGLVASRMFVVGLSLDWMELGGEFLHELFGKSEHGWIGLRWVGQDFSSQCRLLSHGDRKMF